MGHFEACITLAALGVARDEQRVIHIPNMARIIHSLKGKRKQVSFIIKHKWEALIPVNWLVETSPTRPPKHNSYLEGKEGCSWLLTCQSSCFYLC